MNVEPYSIPLVTPLETATGTVSRREGLLVRVDVDGHVGIGDAAPLDGFTESYDDCRAALDSVANRLEAGEFATALRDLSDVPAARHGVVSALNDARAKLADRPLYRHLEETVSRFEASERRIDSVGFVDRLPVNGTVGMNDTATTVDHATNLVEDGFECVKLKVGPRDTKNDLARVHSVRDAVGPHVELRLDANESWTRDQVDRVIGALHRANVSYVEQPLSRYNLDGLAALRERGVQVAVDESLIEHRLVDVLSAGAADVVVLKPMALGGPDRARLLGLRALTQGVTPVVTTTIDSVVARTVAVHVAACLPARPACGLATASLLEADLGVDPAPVEDGEITVPQSPGWGGELE